MYSNNQWDVQEKDYISSSSFIIRIINILILFAAWICGAAALDNGSAANSDLQSTRIAFLVISLIAFVECIAILVASILDVLIEILYIILDSIMLVLMFIVSIAAAVRDTQVANGSISGAQYRYGSLAAGAVFGFISVVLFLELIILYLRDLADEESQ